MEKEKHLTYNNQQYLFLHLKFFLACFGLIENKYVVKWNFNAQQKALFFYIIHCLNFNSSFLDSGQRQGA